MSALDELVNAVPVAVRKALGPSETNVLRFPEAAPPAVRQGVLIHADAGDPAAAGGADPGLGSPARVVFALGPGATVRGVAALLLPLFTQAGVTPAPATDDLAKAIVVYAQAYVSPADRRFHQVGLLVPVPVEVDDQDGAWIVDADQVRALAAAFAPAWRPVLTTPPAALPAPDPDQIDGDARALLAIPHPADAVAAPLRARLLRNPFEGVLFTLAVLRRQAPDAAGATALATVSGLPPNALAPVATTSAGNAVLRRLAAVLRAAPAGAHPDEVQAAQDLLEGALHEGPAGARTLVAHRELPESAAQLATRPGTAATTVGATADPPGGLHRLVLGRDVAVGRPASTKAGGVTTTGPEFAGRLPLAPLLRSHAAEVNPTDDDNLRGRLVLASIDPAVRPFDAVAAKDAGVLRVGLRGWAAGGAGDLAGLLDTFKTRTPDEFDLFFVLHGLDVGPDPAHLAPHVLHRVAADGTTTALAGDDLVTFFGGTTGAGGAVTYSSDWAARFRLAALASLAWRLAQATTAADEIASTAPPLDIGVASVDPFPPSYALALDEAGSPGLKANLEGPGKLLDDLVAAHVQDGNFLAGAVVDLNGGPAVTPVYAGYHDDDTFYVGSMNKAAALYAAIELRTRLRLAAKAAGAFGFDTSGVGWKVPFVDAVKRLWAPRVTAGFPGFDTRPPRHFPHFDDMFSVGDGGAIDFTLGTATDADVIALDTGVPGPTFGFLELLKSMIFMSNAIAASRVIDAVSFPYLNGALREGGFFAPDKDHKDHGTGIWLSSNYVGKWRPGPDVMALSPRGKDHYKATTDLPGNARQFARLLALAARAELFADAHAADPHAGDAAACGEMLDIMRKDQADDRDRSYVLDGLHKAGRPVTKVSSKLGINVVSPGRGGREGTSDCAVVRRTKGGTPLLYVVVFVGGFIDTGIADEDLDPEMQGFLDFVKVLDDAIDSHH